MWSLDETPTALPPPTYKQNWPVFQGRFLYLFFHTLFSVLKYNLTWKSKSVQMLTVYNDESLFHCYNKVLELSSLSMKLSLFAHSFRGSWSYVYSWVLLRASGWPAPLWQECMQKRDRDQESKAHSFITTLSRGLVRVGVQEKYLSSFWGYGQSPPRLFHIRLLQCLTCCELSDPVHGQTPSEPQPRSNTWVLIIALWVWQIFEFAGVSISSSQWQGASWVTSC